MSDFDKVYQSTDPEELLQGRKKPKDWDSKSKGEKLDWIATRILAEDRHHITSHTEMKESGILSVSQYERRLAREVYSTDTALGDIDNQDVPVDKGIFGRVHAAKKKRRGRHED